MTKLICNDEDMNAIRNSIIYNFFFNKLLIDW
jgi:hypothetical protein